jgi:hypothetical protein
MARGWLIVISLAGLAGAAAGQQPLPPGAVKMDPGVGDRKLGVGRIDLRQDLRMQNDFGTVYRFTAPNPYGGPGNTGQTMFMRIEGGTTAVFPQSVYVPTRQGEIPLVPPGTTFYIGDLPRPWMSQHEAPPPRAPNYLDLRADTRAQGLALPSPAPNAPATPAADPGPPTIWNSETYRVRVVGELIDSAGAARP